MDFQRCSRQIGPISLLDIRHVYEHEAEHLERFIEFKLSLLYYILIYRIYSLDNSRDKDILGMNNASLYLKVSVIRQSF